MANNTVTGSKRYYMTITFIFNWKRSRLCEALDYINQQVSDVMMFDLMEEAKHCRVAAKLAPQR